VPPYAPGVRELVDRALAEDFGDGDLTSRAVVPEDARARARFVQREPGVLAGLDVAEAVVARVDRGVTFRVDAEEGAWRGPGAVAEVEGSARSILAAERVALNLLGQLSGVATRTARFVAAVAGTGVEILDTRKTTPGLRSLERRAVVLGGGRNHRFGLFDHILVKENHAALAGGVGEAARRALEAAAPRVEVVVECATLAELEEALAAGAPRVLLDNMSLEDLRAGVGHAAGRTVVEASGGVTLETVRAIAETGVDLISVGSLTHSAPALDVSLELDPL